MKKIKLLSLAILISLSISAQNKNGSVSLPFSQKELIIRLDDIGMCHSSNMGAQKIFATGIPVSASLMTVGPWFDEAVMILKKYPNVAVGIHLALNAEWEFYKWGPVLGKQGVPSLVDSCGNFTYKNTWFLKDKFKMDEMERELEAQILKAINAGLKVDYLDGHMGAFFMFPQHVELVLKMAKKYHLGISGFFGENKISGAEGYFNGKGLNEFVNSLSTITDGVTLMVSHPGADTPEMQVLHVQVDNPSKPAPDGQVAKQRNAVAEYISSKTFIDAVAKKNIKLINYKELVLEKGLDSMKK